MQEDELRQEYCEEVTVMIPDRTLRLNVRSLSNDTFAMFCD